MSYRKCGNGFRWGFIVFKSYFYPGRWVHHSISLVRPVVMFLSGVWYRTQREAHYLHGSEHQILRSPALENESWARRSFLPAEHCPTMLASTRIFSARIVLVNRNYLIGPNNGAHFTENLFSVEMFSFIIKNRSYIRAIGNLYSSISLKIKLTYKNSAFVVMETERIERHYNIRYFWNCVLKKRIKQTRIVLHFQDIQPKWCK